MSNKSRGSASTDSKIVKIIAIILALVLIGFVIWAIAKQVKEHNLQDDPKLHELRKNFVKFFKKDKYWSSPLDPLNNRNIMDEISLYKGDKSYTINKEKVFICLLDEKGEYYDDNMLIYVIAHEISHAICNSVGHTDEFHQIFEALQKELAIDGLLDPNKPIVSDYCEYNN